MSTFACRKCGAADNFQVFEMAPRHRDINVIAGDDGRPLEDDGPGDNDEVFYEASEFRAYRCGSCGTEVATLAELIAAQSA